MEHIRRHKMYTRVARETCLRETGRAPINTGWAEKDKGQPGKPNARARWVAKEYKTHARPELYASPPLEALKVVLSEIATGKHGRWTCGGRAFSTGGAAMQHCIPVPTEFWHRNSQRESEAIVPGPPQHCEARVPSSRLIRVHLKPLDCLHARFLTT